MVLIFLLAGIAVNVLLRQRDLDQIEFGEVRISTSLGDSWARGWHRLGMEYDDARASAAQLRLRLALVLGIAATFVAVLLVGPARSGGAASLLYQVCLALTLNLVIVLVQEGVTGRRRGAIVATGGALVLGAITVGLGMLAVAP